MRWSWPCACACCVSHALVLLTRIGIGSCHFQPQRPSAACTVSCVDRARSEFAVASRSRPFRSRPPLPSLTAASADGSWSGAGSGRGWDKSIHANSLPVPIFLQVSLFETNHHVGTRRRQRAKCHMRALTVAKPFKTHVAFQTNTLQCITRVSGGRHMGVRPSISRMH